MTDIWDYRTIIDSEGYLLQLKGVADSPGLYWLLVKVKPSFQFCGESELFVPKDDILKLIDELGRMITRTEGNCTIRCSGWGSYVNFEIGKHGALYVSGQLNKRWEGENNHLRFKLASDQTIIPGIVQVLKDIVSD